MRVQALEKERAGEPRAKLPANPEPIDPDGLDLVTGKDACVVVLKAAVDDGNISVSEQGLIFRMEDADGDKRPDLFVYTSAGEECDENTECCERA